MRQSSLVLAVILLFGTGVMAQHTGGGGSSGGGSSGGGSHGGGSSSSGGSHYSAGGGSSGSHSGGHSPGGSVSHGSGSHGSSGGSGLSHSRDREPRSNAVHPIFEPKSNLFQRPEQPQKRGFLSFLRHPFHRPHPKPVDNLRRWICVKGPCVCPAGQVSNGGGGCAGAGASLTNNRYFCSQLGFWYNACGVQVNYPGDCSGQRMAMEQQAQRMQQAEAARQNACNAGPTQECSDLTTRSQSESTLYRTLAERYRRCLQRSWVTGPYGEFTFGNYLGSRLFDPVAIDLGHR